MTHLENGYNAAAIDIDGIQAKGIAGDDGADRNLVPISHVLKNKL